MRHQKIYKISFYLGNMVKKVMMVDDSKFMRMVLKDIIDSTDDFEVVCEVDDGSKALEVYKQCRPDIVTMDIIMPTSGMEALKEIKAFDPNAKVVMITAMGGQVMVMEEAIAAGAEKRYISKPFKQDVVRSVLKEL